MAVIFNDSIESGAFAAWTSSAPSGTCTLTAAAGSAQSGSFGAAATFNSPATDVNDEAALKLTFTEPANKHTWLRCWSRINAMTSVGYGSLISKAIMMLGSTADAQVRVIWASIVSTNQVQFNYQSKAGTDTALSGPQTMPVGTWFRWGLHIDRNPVNPIIECYFNNAVLATVSDASAGTQGAANAIDQMRVGIVHAGQFEKGVYSIDIDDVVLGNSDPDADIFPAVPLRYRGARVAGWK